MDYAILIIIVLTISIASRYILVYLNRNWFRQGFVGDSSVHIEIIRQLKEDKRSKKIHKYVIPNTMTYPIGYHRLVKLLPIDLVEKKQWLPNLIVFSVFTAIYSVYVRYIEVMLLDHFEWSFVVIALFFYFFSTSNLIFRGPSIAYIKLSERLYGRMSTGMYYLCLVMWLGFGDVSSALLAVVFCAMAITSTTFGLQVVLFTMPFISVINLTYSNIVIVIFGIVVAIIISEGYAVKNILQRTKYWGIYKKFVGKSKIHRPSLSSYINLKKLFSILKKGDIKQAVWILFENEPTRAILYYPELLLVGVLAIFFQSEYENLFYSIVPILIVYMATATRAFNHFGEAYRYIEYSMVFVMPLLISIAVFQLDVSTIGWILCVYGLYLVVFYAVHYLRYSSTNTYPERDFLKQFLKSVPLNSASVVFPVSMRLGADICARVNCKSFWWQPGGITEPDMYEKFIEEYPFLKRNYTRLFDEYGVTHIICDKAAVKKLNWQYDFSYFDVISEDSRYIAYRV